MAKHGQGSVTRTRSGKWQVRLTDASGRRRTLGCYDTEEEAHEVRRAAVKLLGDDGMAPVGAITFAAYAQRWLERQERRKTSSIRTYRSAVRRLVKADWAALPIDAVTMRDIRHWVGELIATGELMPNSIKSLVGIAARIFRDANEEDGLIDESPVTKIKVKGDSRHTPWTWLRPDEAVQLWSCEAVDEDERLFIVWTIGTGLRKWEALAMRESDLRLDENEIVVRYGSENDGPTKNKRVRRVPLLPLARAAVTAWLQVEGDWVRRNPRGLLWPGRRGGYRTKMVNEFQDRIRAANIGRRVRFHDLRHTAAAWLVSGVYVDSEGRPSPWRLELVRDFLGHATVKQTERYAHLADNALRDAARQLEATPIGLATATPKTSKILGENTIRLSKCSLSHTGHETSRAIADPRERSQSVAELGLSVPTLNPIDLEIQRHWTPWGPPLPQLGGDPPDMTEQLRAAEGWA